MQIKMAAPGQWSLGPLGYRVLGPRVRGERRARCLCRGE